MSLREELGDLAWPAANPSVLNRHSTRLRSARERSELVFTRDLARAAETLSLTDANQAMTNVYEALRSSQDCARKVGDKEFATLKSEAKQFVW